VFTPRTPTVLILVDQGGAEFTSATAGNFFNVRTAVETAIAAVDGQYRFGFGSYVGVHSSTTCNLQYTSVPIAAFNTFAIEATYGTLGPLLPYNTNKAETPAVEALPLAQAALAADTGNGGRYLLFFTTGGTDFCDDSVFTCSADAVTYEIQKMYAGSPSIETLVVGLPPAMTSFLQEFATAGAGQPMGALDPTTASNYYALCDVNTDGGAESWPSLFVASGKTAPDVLTTYAGPAGSAPLYMAASNSVADIETQVNAALAEAKSCSFDLSTYSVDMNKLGEATVTLNGTRVPQDASLGWTMASPSQLVLNGFACTTWRTPAATIAFDFPCDILSP
jgi:hypothetical protein